MPDRKASTFNEHCIIALGIFNNTDVKSLTVDRGKEFAGYLELEDKLNLDVYFADAYSSCSVDWYTYGYCKNYMEEVN